MLVAGASMASFTETGLDAHAVKNTALAKIVAKILMTKTSDAVGGG